MDDKNPLFILAGNGPYENKGCEAIVRGTTRILREHFNDPRFICLSFFQSDEQYKDQCRYETDKAITHLTARLISKSDIVRSFWKPDSWRIAYQHLFNRNALIAQTYRDLAPYLDSASAALSIGGDNYSLDYGIPTLFTGLNDLVIDHGKPLVLWGASVGPFGIMPDYERCMADHLQKVTGIFARESATIEYLESIGITSNVYPVADPAFLMEPVKPDGIDEEMPIEEGAIGLNLSPLMAKYVTGGDLETWTRIASSIISDVARATELPVYLISHVTSPHDNDYAFLQNALSLSNEKGLKITVVPPHYNATETKWIIGQMAVFAGARTHATIAALSSEVPCLSFAYSMKAKGINRDIFGHNDYCLNPADLKAKTVTAQIQLMLDHAFEIRNDLRGRIPVVQQSARIAGSTLKNILGDRTDA